MELVTDRATREPAGTLTNDVLRYCHAHGLALLKAGLYDNVIRLLFPLVISEQELDRGLDILEEALSAVPASGSSVASSTPRPSRVRSR